MKSVLIFSGTTEGRTLAERLHEDGMNCTVCVATEYGTMVMEPMEGVKLHQGRLSTDEMKMLITSEDFLAVVDATHPFATLVSENIKNSLVGTHTPYIRLKRETQDVRGEYEGVTYYPDSRTCAKALETVKGIILLTTGSKELKAFCENEEVRSRIYARVLPGLESISLCMENNLVGKQILALQGPFSVEMNEAMIRQYKIECLVTKESGVNGGYFEKLQAAQNTGIPVMVIGNPEVLPGLSFEEVCKEIELLAGRMSGDETLNKDELNRKSSNKEMNNRNSNINSFNQNSDNKNQNEKSPNTMRNSEDTDIEIDIQNTRIDTENTINIGNPHRKLNSSMIHTQEQHHKELDLEEYHKGDYLTLSLIGMGPGSAKLLTREAEDALGKCEILFGAKRLLDEVEGDLNSVDKFPYYLPKDIVPKINEISLKNPHIKNIGILFSGDSGFYSGADKLNQALKEELKASGKNVSIVNYPGISSISYFAARLSISWQDGKLISIHGRKANVLETIRTNRKTFLLVSGVTDMKYVGGLLAEHGSEDIELYIGYQLSYPQEEIKKIRPEECSQLEEDGLYVCCILNPSPDNKSLTHGLPDEAFIRDKVPMTKEEVREVSICKLGLHQGAILYDIGSGTGSIAVECARLSESIQVYAIERKKEALQLIEQNKKQFDLSNIQLVQGEAPEVLNDLPIPTHAFIGGSGGNLKEILQVLYQKNPASRVVINAITLETVGEITGVFSSLPIEKEEILQMQVSRAQKVGGYHLMKAENPVYIASFQFSEESE